MALPQNIYEGRREERENTKQLNVGNASNDEEIPVLT
jgi:hypothetical protein